MGTLFPTMATVLARIDAGTLRHRVGVALRKLLCSYFGVRCNYSKLSHPAVRS